MLLLASWKVRAGMALGLLSLLVFVPAAAAQIGNGTQAPPAGPPPGNNAPTIVSLTTEQVAGQRFRIRGRVQDETPVGVVVSGAANGVAMCDAAGNFDAIFNVPTLGQITCVPGDGTQSGPAVTRVLTNAAPTCSVSAIQGPNNTWTFSGTVGDEAPEGLGVTLTGPQGVNGASTTAGAGGGWTITLTLPAGASGTVAATVTDWYGLTGSGYTNFGS